MHRAQGMTYERTISAMHSADRLLNSASLFYVLNSRAREDSTIHMDNKDAVSRSIENHRGATPNALDLAPELRDLKGAPGAKGNAVDAALDRSLARAALEILGISRDREEKPVTQTAINVPQKQLSEPAPSKTYDFDIGM
jgi:hypothetical protein